MLEIRLSLALAIASFLGALAALVAPLVALRLIRVRARLKRDPDAHAYRDIALTPSTTKDIEDLELLSGRAPPALESSSQAVAAG